MLDAVGKAGNVPYRPGTRCCNKCAENVDQEEKFTTYAEYKPKEAQFRFWVVHNFPVDVQQVCLQEPPDRDKIKVPDPVVKEQ